MLTAHTNFQNYPYLKLSQNPIQNPQTLIPRYFPIHRNEIIKPAKLPIINNTNESPQKMDVNSNSLISNSGDEVQLNVSNNNVQNMAEDDNAVDLEQSTISTHLLTDVKDEPSDNTIDWEGSTTDVLKTIEKVDNGVIEESLPSFDNNDIVILERISKSQIQKEESKGEIIESSELYDTIDPIDDETSPSAPTIKERMKRFLNPSMMVSQEFPI